MNLLHVVTHHVDCSQQAPPVAESQQQAKHHLLVKQERNSLRLRMRETAFLAALAAHRMYFDTMR
uniref:Uncharacterized protein n=1 Tax=Peronospora matthiolae TaxID=2874970 RepID=A0AAV1UMT2_9STRA